MATKVAGEARAKYIIVRNQTDGFVSFSHPDTSVPNRDVTIPAYGAVALDSKLWADVPDLDRLIGQKLLTTEFGNKRPSPPPRLPPEMDMEGRVEYSVIRQIALTKPPKPDDLLSREMPEGVALALISLVPELETPRLTANENEKFLDVKYLKQMHAKTLRAARWLLKEYNLPWSEERIAQIDNRLDWINKLQV